MTEESKIGAKRKIKLCSQRLVSQTVGHDTDAKSARITVRALHRHGVETGRRWTKKAAHLKTDSLAEA